MHDGHYSQFRTFFNKLGSNNPQGTAALTDHLENFVQIMKDGFEPSFTNAVSSATKATAVLYTALMLSKRESIDLGLYNVINKTGVGSFGTRYVTWALRMMELKLPKNANVSWARLRKEMASSLDVMIIKLEHLGTSVTTEQVDAWIDSQGGIGKLGMDYLTIKNEEKAQAERDRIEGARFRKLKQAKDAGFETVEEHEAYTTKVTIESKEAMIRSKFPAIKLDLVKNGEVIVSPQEHQLLIYSDGKLYAISDKDEYMLLSCAASLLV